MQCEGTPTSGGQVYAQVSTSQSADGRRGLRGLSLHINGRDGGIPATRQSSGKRMQLLLVGRLLISPLVFCLKRIWVGHPQ